MGYYKNRKATQEVYDPEGFVHSGDLGSLKDGFLEITGRIKELIITAGGENIPPVMLEHTFKEICPIVSNIMVIGDNRRFLAAIISLKVNTSLDNVPAQELTNECKMLMKKILGEEEGERIKTAKDAMGSAALRQYVDKCFETANNRAISRAQHIRKWAFIENDFSVSGGELTPSMKMRRKVIEKMYEKLIEAMYADPKL